MSLCVVALDLGDKARKGWSVVSLLGRHMNEDGGAINAFPMKGMMGKAVHDGPRKLLSHEKIVPAFF